MTYAAVGASLLSSSVVDCDSKDGVNTNDKEKLASWAKSATSKLNSLKKKDKYMKPIKAKRDYINNS